MRKFWARIWDPPECIKSLTVACKAQEAPLIDIFAKAEAHKFLWLFIGNSRAAPNLIYLALHP